MIKELSDLGKRLREEQKDKKKIHNALKEEPFSIDLLIREDGSFDSFIVFPRRLTTIEAITAKKGKARLLLDKAEEILCFKNENRIEEIKRETNSNKKIEKYLKGVEYKHQLFLQKLNLYKHLPDLAPVFLFYYNNKEKGIDKAVKEFPNQVDTKSLSENIAFRLIDETERLHEKHDVQNEIIKIFEKNEKELLLHNEKKCSLCGLSDFPVTDLPHGTIKGVPGGLSAGNTLVSYNEHAFESYFLKGNENSSICINCARTYVEGLRWLLNNGHEILQEDKRKTGFQYTNRKKFGSDTAMIYWTKECKSVDELDLLDKPDAQQIGILIDSVTSGREDVVKSIENDIFYSCTLSGAAARIAVRDWIEISLSEYRRNIGQWFFDIAIRSYGKTYYAPLYWLARAGHNEKSDSDSTLSRTATHLWNAALKNSKPPLWILHAVLKRLRYIEYSDDGKIKNDPVTKERAALIRLILNRNRQEGGYEMKEQLDKENLSPAYVCGQIFAVMVDIQRAALGKDINAGIRERYFSYASTTPAPAFGRLMKLAQTHLTKIKNDKPGLQVILDRELQVECAKLHDNTFPAILSLEEQGQFALGYYHKKEETWQKALANKELKEALENEEEEK